MIRLPSYLKSVTLVSLTCLIGAVEHSRVPAQSSLSQPEIATMVAYVEGPTVDQAGNVYFSDIINQRSRS